MLRTGLIACRNFLARISDTLNERIGDLSPVRAGRVSRANNHQELVDEICLEPPDRLGIERAVDRCPCAACLCKSFRVNDLFRCLPPRGKMDQTLSKC
jgi:hypothetical protein